jgi:hypothetical protein
VPQDTSDRKRVLSDQFDETFAVGPVASDATFLGSNVLQWLVDGIDDLAHQHHERANVWKETLCRFRFRILPRIP